MRLRLAGTREQDPLNVCWIGRTQKMGYSRTAESVILEGLLCFWLLVDKNQTFCVLKSRTEIHACMRGEGKREKNYAYPILDHCVHSLPLFLGMCPHSGASPVSFQLYKAGKKCDYYFGLIFNQF